MVSERIRTDPETGVPQTQRDVSDASREMQALRLASKQVRDANWNVDKARDESSDADRKKLYRDLSAQLDKIHASLAATYKALGGKGTREAPPRQEQEHPHNYNMAPGIRSFMQPKPNHDGPDPNDPPPDPDSRADVEVVPRGRTATGMDRTSPTSIYASEGRMRDGRKMLAEAEAELSMLRDTHWFPNDQTNWATPVTPALSGGQGSEVEMYGLGDKTRGVVRATSSEVTLGGLQISAKDVAKAIAGALEELYGDARMRDNPWYGHTAGMPDDLPEGLIVTQEEVYYSIRKLAGEYAVTGDYYDEVIDELNKLGHRVTTNRPHTLDRRQHTA